VPLERSVPNANARQRDQRFGSGAGDSNAV
jgi:hypothetical protein